MTNLEKTITAILAIILLVCAYQFAQAINENQEYKSRAEAKQHSSFENVPDELIHTMRVYEDGSYRIEYKDGTSEVGCMPSGICQD